MTCSLALHIVVDWTCSFVCWNFHLPSCSKRSNNQLVSSFSLHIYVVWQCPHINSCVVTILLLLCTDFHVPCYFCQLMQRSVVDSVGLWAVTGSLRHCLNFSACTTVVNWQVIKLNGMIVWDNELSTVKRYHLLLVLMQMKGKREFPPDVPSSGDVLSHLSESGILSFSLLLNIRNHRSQTFLV